MPAVEEKKLLFISYYFPPTKTVATLRIFNFHHEAQKHFAEVFALTTSNRQRFPHDDFDFDDSKTTEIPTYDLRRFLSKKNATPSVGQSRKESRLARFIIKLSYSFPFNIFLADGGLIYILRGYFKGKKIIREHKITFLFSSYKPYADHLICFLLKRWNPQLVWIADFRDLHVDEIRKNVFFPKLQKWFNRRILKRADIVTTVSKGLEKKLGPYNSQTYVLRNGISAKNTLPQNTKHFDKFTIAYTGSIYPEFQTAEIFFQALKNLIVAGIIDEEKVQLIYAGKENGVWEKWINEFSFEKINTTYGFLPLKEAQEIQQKSHVNLLLSWSSKNQKGILTAKFYEYLLAQNPILLIIKGEKDEEFEEIFEELRAGEVAYPQSEYQKTLESFILKNYQSYLKTKNPPNLFPEEKLAPFTWKFQMKAFVNFIEQKILSNESN